MGGVSEHYVKLKVHPRTGCDGPEEEYRYNFTLSLTSGLEGGKRPGRFTPGKDTRYPQYSRLDGPRGRRGPVLKKSRSLPGFDPRTVFHTDVITSSLLSDISSRLKFQSTSTP
jgi:hypothetical protein